MLKRLLLVVMLCTPLAAWALLKPVRVVAPEWAGLSCVTDTLCTDDVSRTLEAAALYDEALTFVDVALGAIDNKPRVIFCGSDACSESFGLGRRAGMTIGTFGIVINTRGWKPFYVRHELIHHLQNERLGMFVAWTKPEWLVEGMAYALSEDPRQKLSEPFQQYRSEFENWYATVGKERIWSEAGKL
ncbi:MAG: hypothetical protein LUQ11_08145 [Methylococcaceae bacterium]|nr:hypothetical protein [Methylococcaceae bacterium]